MKSKIIDLLNKIANGEKIPKKIKYQNYIYEYQHRRDTENCFNYMCNENGEYLSRRYFIDNILNDDVEIIEEKYKDSQLYIHDFKEEIERLNNIINELEKYINEEYIYDELGMKIFDASELQDKLQELKGSDSNVC